jgi:hypothetical protein
MTPDDGDRQVGLLPFIVSSRPGSFESADDNVPVPDDAGSHSRQEVPRRTRQESQMAEPTPSPGTTSPRQGGDERLIADVRDVFRLAPPGWRGVTDAALGVSGRGRVVVIRFQRLCPRETCVILDVVSRDWLWHELTASKPMTLPSLVRRRERSSDAVRCSSGWLGPDG